MLDEKTLVDLNVAFKRIFAMPITKSTFRELQNTIATATNGNVATANSFYETLLSGEIKKDLIKKENEKVLKDFVDQYSISIRTAREVFENGEFINLITSDILTRQNRLAFLTQIRRTDGQELQFLTDPEGTLNIVQHFLGRLLELKRNPQTTKIFDYYKEKLEGITKSIDELKS